MARLFGPQARRSLIISAAAGVFLALTGALGSGAAPLGVRLAYWVGLSALGGLLGGAMSEIARRWLDFEAHPWRSTAALALGLSIPFTAMVFAVTGLTFGGGFSLARLIGFFPPVLLVTAAITGLNVLAQTRRAAAAQAEAEAGPPRFLDRLPPKLRGGELWAVEAEDHYLRLHTSKGQDLILFRLSDAVAELAGVEGARTHRSWWVAREAVADVKRGDGRATLTLKDGSRIPVSRAYARALRAAGWF